MEHVLHAHHANASAVELQCADMQSSACAGPFTWSSGAYGPGNMQALEAMLRMWGISPESQRWQDMMRDFKRGETVFNQVRPLTA